MQLICLLESYITHFNVENKNSSAVNVMERDLTHVFDGERPYFCVWKRECLRERERYFIPALVEMAQFLMDICYE